MEPWSLPLPRVVAVAGGPDPVRIRGANKKLWNPSLCTRLVEGTLKIRSGSARKSCVALITHSDAGPGIWAVHEHGALIGFIGFEMGHRRSGEIDFEQ